ncbi:MULTISPECIES: hypothetical protein [unclassified Streptomyces]|uniref:hypothetical protein n=1 Tax=unclassified Streptomyces TaxID=2593676 RepID=UPI00340A3B8B
MTAVEIVRSTISTGLNTFISLYWIRHLGAGSGLGGIALTLELGGGVLGTLLGGRLADRIGMVRTVQIGNAAMLPALWLMLACDNKYAALPSALLVGLISNIPFAVLIKLGQDYLPSRPGTAAGVTLGLAMSAGGLFMPATVTDTAHACGWASTSAFVGIFAQAMRTTPGTYRTGVLNQQEDGHVAGRAGVLSAP